MLILISPAKKVNEARAGALPGTTPRFLDAAAELADVAQAWSPAEISRIMDVSPAIAELNRDRFATWTREGDFAAGLLFDGDVYKALELKTLDDAALNDARTRLRILSGLYGLLRPSDEIRPYRLEMGRKLPGHPAGTLYRFWGARIAEAVAEDARALGTDIVLNLASEEYARSVAPEGLGGLRMITPRFEEDRSGTRRVIGVAAKRARGAMARWVLQEAVTDPQDLRAFAVGGYAHDAESATPDRPVFVRAG